MVVKSSLVTVERFKSLADDDDDDDDNGGCGDLEEAVFSLIRSLVEAKRIRWNGILLVGLLENPTVNPKTLRYMTTTVEMKKSANLFILLDVTQ